jgi:hypothetical protein
MQKESGQLDFSLKIGYMAYALQQQQQQGISHAKRVPSS